jgi:hypothetical protein
MFGRITPVVRNLLIINVAIFFLSSLFNIDINEYLSLRNLHSEYFLPFQFFTYMFLHGSTWHLISNMFGLFIFGPLLEQFWGPKRFLVFYIVTGVGAGILYSGINYYETNQFESAVEKYNEQPSPGEFKYVMEKKAHISVKSNAEINSFIYDYNDHPEDPSYISQSKQISQAGAIYEKQLANGRGIRGDFWDTAGFWRAIPQYGIDAAVPANSNKGKILCRDLWIV